MNVFSNGLGGSTGDTLVTCEPLQTTGNVRWVDSNSGSDTNSGLDREAPKLTIGSAVTAAAAGDIIVCKDGHTESLAASVSLLEGMVVVGEGSSAGYPTVKLTSSAGDHVFECSAGAEVRNIWFCTPTAAQSVGDIHITAARVRVIGCYFECGANIDGAAVMVGVGCGADVPYVELRNCTFVSTGGSAVGSTQPACALRVQDQVSHLVIENCVFDDGLYGFSGDYAVDIRRTMGPATYPTHIKATEISLLRGASILVDSTATGLLNVSVRTGGGRIKW
jgi:hypothetical protein